MRSRTALVMGLAAIFVCLGPMSSWSRADQTCRHCHPMGFTMGGHFEKTPHGWSIADILSRGFDSPCPGLEETAAQVDMTHRTRARLDLLIQNQNPENKAAAGYGMELEAMAWRWRSILGQPPRSAGFFEQQAADLRDHMNDKILLPIFEQDLDQRIGFSLVVLSAALIITALLWLFRRFRMKSHGG